MIAIFNFDNVSNIDNLSVQRGFDMYMLDFRLRRIFFLTFCHFKCCLLFQANVLKALKLTVYELVTSLNALRLANLRISAPGSPSLSRRVFASFFQTVQAWTQLFAQTALVVKKNVSRQNLSVGLLVSP